MIILRTDTNTGETTNGTIIDLARQIYQDAREVITEQGNLTLHLDLAMASLEFQRALGEDFRPGESMAKAMTLFRAGRDHEPWLYGGVAHVGWLAIQLANESGADISGLHRIDDMIMSWILEFPDDRDVDLPFGLLGLGVYALSHPVARVRADLTDAILTVIERRVEHDNGVFLRLAPWEARIRVTPHLVGQRDLGVAHGNAGLVSYLASAAMSGLPSQDRAAALLTESLRWLTRQRCDLEGTIFPQTVESRYATARSAWCYGDPGVALALTVAAEASGNDQVRALAAETAAAAIARPAELTRVHDACLCHGAAGLVWFGHRTALDHGHDTDAYVTDWVADIARRRAAGPLIYTSVVGRRRDHTFLEGDLGTALVLLYRATGVEPLWQERLLGVAVRPDRGGRS
ncbi:lanthionine synthetase LanC family protein [Actinokineospora enzanensis]|uniref:lanthionine synthetase LanC family protein n=1 Tax=Actinokineospora enzanensis TaxID=155975 RepID=UPI00037537B6|nr:lanthionine synthetase LanC family protein [Actinokineospora enzanensis]